MYFLTSSLSVGNVEMYSSMSKAGCSSSHNCLTSIPLAFLFKAFWLTGLKPSL
jgi:hypothetical protein